MKEMTLAQSMLMMRLLMVVRRWHPSPMPAAELCTKCEHLGLTMVRIHRIKKNAIYRGLLVSLPLKGRAKQVALTEKGEEFLREVFAGILNDALRGGVEQ